MYYTTTHGIYMYWTFMRRPDIERPKFGISCFGIPPSFACIYIHYIIPRKIPHQMTPYDYYIYAILHTINGNKNIPGIQEIHTRLRGFHVNQMLGKAIQLWLEFNNGLDGSSYVDVIVVVSLRRGLETSQNSTTVCIGTMNNDNLKT